MATQDIMSGWFWMKNSWLSIGGFLVEPVRLLTGILFHDLAKIIPNNPTQEIYI